MRFNRFAHLNRSRGFTLIELILVIFIMALLTAMTTPMLFQFVKTTKVQQTVKAISTSLYRARTEAMRTRKMVGVYFGEDPTSCKTPPLPGVLPSKGRIEVWTVRDSYDSGDFQNEGGCMGSTTPYNLPFDGANWYPYRHPDRCLTPEPISYPDGVRILAGKFSNNATAPKYVFGWPKDYMATAEGEIKRHNITFASTGAMAMPIDGVNSWWNLLIFDEQTGEYTLLSCGEWLTSARPRVLNFQLSGLYGPSGTYYPLTNKLDIPKLVEQ